MHEKGKKTQYYLYILLKMGLSKDSQNKPKINVYWEKTYIYIYIIGQKLSKFFETDGCSAGKKESTCAARPWKRSLSCGKSLYGSVPSRAASAAAPGWWWWRQLHLAPMSHMSISRGSPSPLLAGTPAGRRPSFSGNLSNIRQEGFVGLLGQKSPWGGGLRAKCQKLKLQFSGG